MKILKEFISSLVQNLFITVVVALITVPVLVSWITDSFDVLLRVLGQESPVWLLMLCTGGCVIYTKYKKNSKIDRYVPEVDRFLIEDSGFKWRVVDHKNGYASVDQIPLCSVHESDYVLTSGKQYKCRESVNSECDSEAIDHLQLTFYWELAKSKANSIINKYETKS
ncbi:hypothetical protein L2712_04040 [Shewanella marisflavi]|uniref:hypothetical protein n=1 Tax=Shewanella marisflavi TaxID=260364 RepID=UPI00200C56F1|nr:hypothetical protein [Shewanella marisflavi]MCL1040824.1 hypothetical protein [Shewanella marisflavi]